MTAGLFSPLGAHNEPPDSEFRKIACREIEVVKSDGNPSLHIGAVDNFGGYVSVLGYGATIDVSGAGSSVRMEVGVGRRRSV